jgi:hypothetical protein
MQDFVDMAEAHAWTLQRLREMAGRLTEQAYQRACAAATGPLPSDDEAHARWMLVFDRMARGLRLSIALEAKLARERRRDAAEIGDALVRAADGRQETRGRAGRSESPTREAEPCERDREAEDDGLPADAPLSRRLDRLRAILDGGGEPAAGPPVCKFVWRSPPRAELTPAPFSDAAADGQGAPAAKPPWRGSG